MALIRDGNGTRSFETLMRYRGAAMAEFMRSLRTLKALQAEQAREQAAGAQPVELPPRQPRAPARLAPRAVAHPKAAHRCAPNEPEPRAPNEYVIPDPPGSGLTLHEPGAPWRPNEPEPERSTHPSAQRRPQRRFGSCCDRAPPAGRRASHEPATLAPRTNPSLGRDRHEAQVV
jgi:hypothetical protein